MKPSSDFVVVGGGVVGLTVALSIRGRWPDASVVVLEKERECGAHASGRNSGVLHAGFYYTADSLKARFSRDGNRELTAYCRERKIRLNRCGKLVVTRNEDELSDLDELFVRAERNGVVVERLTAEDVQRLEPEARTVGEALYSPTTSSVDPREVVASLVYDAAAAGIEVRTGTVYRRRRPGGLMTSRGAVAAGYVVNTAGLYADQIARDYGFGEQYGILPFRGLYLQYLGSAPVPKCHVYPVPRLDNPFLGVHWTTHANGSVSIGPTAIPAFWREHYKGLTNFKVNEMLEIGIRESGLWLHNTQGFRALAWNEMRKRSKRKLLRLARGLVGESTATGKWAWGTPGVRAQLFDTKKRRLEMDFVCLGDDKSLHVLNAVSPAFTCALPFARHVVAEIESHLPGNRSRGRPESHFNEVQDIVPIESNILPTAHSGSGASLNE